MVMKASDKHCISPICSVGIWSTRAQHQQWRAFLVVGKSVCAPFFLHLRECSFRCIIFLYYAPPWARCDGVLPVVLNIAWNFIPRRTDSTYPTRRQTHTVDILGHWLRVNIFSAKAILATPRRFVRCILDTSVACCICRGRWTFVTTDTWQPQKVHSQGRVGRQIKPRSPPSFLSTLVIVMPWGPMNIFSSIKANDAGLGRTQGFTRIKLASERIYLSRTWQPPSVHSQKPSRPPKSPKKARKSAEKVICEQAPLKMCYEVLHLPKNIWYQLMLCMVIVIIGIYHLKKMTDVRHVV